MSGYNHHVRYIGWGLWRMSWTYDTKVSGSRLRFPRTITRDTDFEGATRFAKKWGLTGVAPTKSGIAYAKNLRAEIRSRITKGTLNYAEYFPDSPRARMFGHAQTSVTVSEAQESLIEDLRMAGREETTLAAYTRSASRINEHIGKVRLSDLVPEHFRAMIRKRQVTRKTWNNDLIPIRRALKRALMDGLIQRNPLDAVDIDGLVPKSARALPDPFSLVEIGELLKTSTGQTKNLIQLALYTGMRIEELAALTWADTDFATVSVNKAAQLSIGSAEVKPPKTASSNRTIDLLPKAVEALKAQQSTRFRGEHVFLRWDKFEPISRYKQIRRRWNAVVEASGVRRRAFKQCRHTYASHMLSCGHNALYVASQMGHRGTALLDVYGTWVEDWKGQEERYGT